MSLALEPSHFRAILESLPIGIYVVDSQRKILFWNRGAERITGYLPQDVLGRHCQETPLRHCDGNCVNLCDGHCPLAGTMSDGRPRQSELYLHHREGHRVPIAMRAVPIRDERGVIVGAAESFEERHPGREALLHAHAREVRNRLDGLTGVSDRESIVAYVAACLDDFAEDGAPFGLLSIAVDEMEAFERAHGASGSGRVLQAVAATLSKNLPLGDIVGRWAGERFVAILVDCPRRSLVRTAGLLQQIVRSASIPWWGDRLSVTISVGGAMARDGDSPESLLERAEQALRASVQIGGGVTID